MNGRLAYRVAGVLGFFALGAGCDSVKVTSPDPATLVIAPSSVTLTVGETVQFSVTVRNEAGDLLSEQPVVWSLSPQGVATVASDGKVQGVGLGETIITAMSGAASGTATVVVQTTGQ